MDIKQGLVVVGIVVGVLGCSVGLIKRQIVIKEFSKMNSDYLKDLRGELTSENPIQGIITGILKKRGEN
jgi:hypothetical protein